MLITVYVLKSDKDNSLYIGLTNNLERRISDHNKGNNRSTKSKIPYQLIFTESFESYLEARKREKYLKSGIGRERIKKSITEKRAGIV